MEQKAMVKEVLGGGTASISVNRKSACSGDCHECHGCTNQEEIIVVVAQNLVEAQKGDMVLVESASGTMLKLAALLYIMPLVLMLAFYAIPGATEGIKILYSMTGLILGLIICYFYSRGMKKRREVTFKITKIIS